MIPSKLQFRARSLMHVLPVLPLLAFIACSATTKDDRVVRLPDPEPKQEVACQEHDDCVKEERCGDDEWCQSLWQQYFVEFRSISIPKVDSIKDEDGSAPDPRCYFSTELTGGPQGGSEIAFDTYEGPLSGGGWPFIGPETQMEIVCYDNDETDSDLLGKFCWRTGGGCGPVPVDVLRSGSAKVTLEGEIVDGVSVEFSFEPLGPSKER